jgi:GrpB-like predicted nucleotidyltransferase (UPF0157 family)
MNASSVGSDSVPQALEMSPYDSRWPAMFQQEKERIAKELGDIAVRIDHVGSTAVPGMTAKPIIDIQISVKVLHPMTPYKKILLSLGYTHLSDSPPGDKIYPLFHRPAAWPHTHHIHVCELGQDEEWRHLAYRDLLIANSDIREEYSAIKMKLAQACDLRDPDALSRYATGKSAFVDAIEEKCRRDGYTVV